MGVFVNPGDEALNPYATPKLTDADVPWGIEVNRSLPLNVHLALSATLYRRFRFSGWMEADLIWNGHQNDLICNGESFFAALSDLRRLPKVSIELGSNDDAHLLTVEFQVVWFCFTKAFRIVIDDQTIYSEGEWPQFES